MKPIEQTRLVIHGSLGYDITELWKLGSTEGVPDYVGDLNAIADAVDRQEQDNFKRDFTQNLMKHTNHSLTDSINAPAKLRAYVYTKTLKLDDDA
mgnify:CR=1 FL=1